LTNICHLLHRAIYGIAAAAALTFFICSSAI
jgi:hypothetical protein